MITVRRANVILDVPDEQKYEYLAKGFDVIDENGAVVEHTVPSDVNLLKKAYVDHTNEIKALKKQLADTTSTEKSNSELQEDYNALLADYNDAVEEIENLKATLAEYEAEENSFAEEEKPAKKKASKK